MNIQLTGLTDERVHQCHFLIKQESSELADAFKSTAAHTEELSNFVTREMDSVRKDIFYWKNLTHSGAAVSHFAQLYVQFYRRVRHKSTFISLMKTDEIERHLVVLRYRYNHLAKMMGRVYEASTYLKIVYLDLIRRSQQNIDDGICDNIEPFDANSSCTNLTRKLVVKCLTTLYETFHFNEDNDDSREENVLKFTRRNSLQLIISTLDHVHSPRTHSRAHSLDPSPSASANVSLRESVRNSRDEDHGIAHANRGPPPPPQSSPVRFADDSFDSLYDELRELLEKIETLVITMRRGDKRYPLGVTDLKTRRPVTSELYWFPRLVVAASAIYAGSITFRMYRSGALQQMLKEAYRGMQIAMVDHVLDPCENLLRQIFETMDRREDQIVTLEDLSRSREMLDRMVRDAYKSEHGNTSEPTTDVIMDELMKKYEQGLRNPVTEMVFGNLTAIMLIQMQKLKVHTESAMFVMDKVLASNQLTMAGTAAMPALLFMGLLVYATSRAFHPSARKPISDVTTAMRLAMMDVERYLAEIYGARPPPMTRVLQEMDLGASPHAPRKISTHYSGGAAPNAAAGWGTQAQAQARRNHRGTMIGSRHEMKRIFAPRKQSESSFGTIFMNALSKGGLGLGLGLSKGGIMGSLSLMNTARESVDGTCIGATETDADNVTFVSQPKISFGKEEEKDCDDDIETGSTVIKDSLKLYNKPPALDEGMDGDDGAASSGSDYGYDEDLGDEMRGVRASNGRLGGESAVSAGAAGAGSGAMVPAPAHTNSRPPLQASRSPTLSGSSGRSAGRSVGRLEAISIPPIVTMGAGLTPIGSVPTICAASPSAMGPPRGRPAPPAYLAGESNAPTEEARSYWEKDAAGLNDAFFTGSLDSYEAVHEGNHSAKADPANYPSASSSYDYAQTAHSHTNGHGQQYNRGGDGGGGGGGGEITVERRVQMLAARGLLCFHLRKVRYGLEALYAHSYWDRSKSYGKHVQFISIIRKSESSHLY
jgi:hypothetical protein